MTSEHTTNSEHKGMMRAYKQLRVWQDAKALYVLTWTALKSWPYDLSKLKRQQLASVDSIHRNIAEGYCRRSLKEYLHFLTIALGSLGESASSLDVYYEAGHLSKEEFEQMDALTFKLENGLKKLKQSLQAKQRDGSWSEKIPAKPKNPTIHPSSNPTIQQSNHPSSNPPIQQSNHPSSNPPIQ